MRPCARCDRHVKLSESVCPFCGEALREAAAPVAWGWAIGLAMLGAACGPEKSDSATGDESSTSETGPSGGGSVTSAAESSTAATTGATTAEPTTGASSAGGSSGGAAFIYASPDGGSGIKECDPWMQDCPSGEKCMPVSLDGDNSWESLQCVPVMPNPGQAGDPCTTEGGGLDGVDTCDVGHMCWDIDPDTGEGTCVKFCTGSPDMPTCDDASTSCTIANDGVLILCLPICDPLLQDCGGGGLCIASPMNPGSFVCVLDASGDKGQEWDPCPSLNACDPGFACLDPALSSHCDTPGSGCCLAFCDVSAPTCTDPAEQCVPWFDMGMAPPGLENVGFCGVPP